MVERRGRSVYTRGSAGVERRVVLFTLREARALNIGSLTLS